MTPERKKTKNIKIRKWNKQDIPALVECHEKSYGDYAKAELFDERIFNFQLENFRDGQFLAEADGQIVGYAGSIIVQLDNSEQFYTYSEITGSGTFTTHNAGGDTLYGADIAVIPEFRSQGISKKLYNARKKLMKQFNLCRMVAHGRIPGYKDHAGKMTAKEYVEKVKQKKLYDIALSAHLKAGYEVKKVLIDFVRDKSSLNYATWLEMRNKAFDEEKHLISSPLIKKPNRRVRVCAGQFEMSKISTWEEFAAHVEFFVDSASTYHCHFLVLPELFTVQLFSMFDPNLNDIQAINKLADYTDKYREVLSQKAMEHNIYIIGGSHPVRRNNEIFNVAHLFCPSGKIYEQDKLHITPSERDCWDIKAGEGIRLFDTPFGRIGIQICYDIEFPEIPRLMTMAGAEIIFVPFSTDERKAYNRVRNCALARAIENYVYVVLSGNVGNLPNVKSYLLNYGQSAIITPSDFAFPPNGLAAEADPNTETVVIADLDITTLHLQREIGSVRPLYDIRTDLYDLKLKGKIEIIKTE